MLESASSSIYHLPTSVAFLDPNDILQEYSLDPPPPHRSPFVRARSIKGPKQRGLDTTNKFDSLPRASPTSPRLLSRRKNVVSDTNTLRKTPERSPLSSINWQDYRADPMPTHLPPPVPPPRDTVRGRPREIKRGAASGSNYGKRSQTPDLTKANLATDQGKKEESRSFFRPSVARRSLSRSRLIQAVLSVPRRDHSVVRYYKDEEEEKVDDYLPSSGGPSAPLSSHLSLSRVSSNRPQRMGRAMRVIVAGAKKVGKTAILRQVACLEDCTKQPYSPTIEDTYQVLLEDGDRPREILVFHDTAGVPDHGPVELKAPYLVVANAFVLVYSVCDHESFNRVDQLKKAIDRHYAKEKKEVPIVVLGNMTDLPGRKVDSEFALAWSQREKVKLFEVSATERNSLIDFVHYIGQRHFHPSKESKFSLSKKLKPEKSNSNAILMDL